MGYFGLMLEIIAFVVNSIPATLAAFSRANLVTFAGSMIPSSIKSQYWRVLAL
jgi:hypothetical protein